MHSESTELLPKVIRALTQIQHLRKRLQYLSYEEEYAFIKRVLRYIDRNPIVKNFIFDKCVVRYDIDAAVETAILMDRKFRIPYDEMKIDEGIEWLAKNEEVLSEGNELFLNLMQPNNSEENESLEISFTYQLLFYLYKKYHRYTLISALYMYRDHETTHLDKIHKSSVEFFNWQVIYPFLGYIETFLEEAKMNIEDNNITYNITGDNNVLGNNSGNNSNIGHQAGARTGETSEEKLARLAEELFKLLEVSEEVSKEDKDELTELMDTIQDRIQNNKPRKTLINRIQEKFAAVRQGLNREQALITTISTICDIINIFK
jgi:hypothetical protein